MRRKNFPVIILAGMMTVYIGLFGGLSLLRHESLHSTYLDLGLESQSIWNTAKGRFLEVSFGENGETISALSYHVSPIVIFLTPLYWLGFGVAGLLIFQTIVLALGALPVFWLARDRLKNSYFALAVSAVYLLYPPLQYANLSDFHPQTLATPLLLFIFYFLSKKMWRRFFLFFFLSLTVKENISLTLVALGLFMIFNLKERKNGLCVLIFSSVWFALAVFWLMPALSGGQMGALSRYDYLGKTPGEIVTRLITDPLGNLRLLLVLPKIKYLFHLLVSVGFLPLLASAALLVALPELALNLFSAYNPMWQVKFHYVSAITSIIFISTIFGLSYLHQFIERRGIGRWVVLGQRLSIIYLLSVAIFWNYLHSPSPLYRMFDPIPYQVTPEDTETRKILKTIPEDASVSAMNNLGAHLSERRFLWRFPIGVDLADYIVVDPSLPGKDFDRSQVFEKDFKELLDKIFANDNYSMTYQSQYLLILKRTSSNIIDTE